MEIIIEIGGGDGGSDFNFDQFFNPFISSFDMFGAEDENTLQESETAAEENEGQNNEGDVEQSQEDEISTAAPAVDDRGKTVAAAGDIFAQGLEMAVRNSVGDRTTSFEKDEDVEEIVKKLIGKSA